MGKSSPAWILSSVMGLSASTGMAANRPVEPEIVLPFSGDTTRGEHYVVSPEDDHLLGTVLFFLSSHCDESRRLGEEWVGLCEAYQEEGFQFLGINSNAGENEEQIREFTSTIGVTVPVLVDPLQDLARHLGVTRNATFVVLNADLGLVYRGDLEGESGDAVAEALEAMIMEDSVSPLRGSGTGSEFTAIDAASVQMEVRYHRDVEPLIQENCLECHRSGQSAPMAFETYDDVRGWAPMIAEVVSTERMPPWHASAQHDGRFRNERRLTETEKATLVRWALSGADQGDAAEAPEPREFEAGEWFRDDPDFVLEIPEEQHIPAEGTIPYRYLEVDPGFTEDRYVRAMQILPTDLVATHHVIVYLLAPGSARGAMLSDPNVALGAGMLAGYAPGSGYELHPEGTAGLIPAGSRFLFELHYTATGVESTDRSKIGIWWSDRTDERIVRGEAIMNFRIDIPPGEPAATFSAEKTIDRPMELLSLTPHMHSRGKSFLYELIRPGQPPEELLNVPNYDFNWQYSFEFDSSPRVEPGDVLRVTAVYDNSSANPHNPDPKARVRWGDQTWEEMFIGFVSYLDIE